MSTTIVKSRLLVVEGRDEEMFFTAALRDHLGLADVQIIPSHGKARLAQILPALVNDPHFSMVQGLGVVRNADLTAPGSTDTSAARAFQSVCGSLGRAGLPCPAGHGQFAAGPPRVGVFIIPNGVDDGMLETLCLVSVSSLPEFPCVDGYFRCLQGHGAVPNNLHKARAHAWLASRAEPDKRVGEAAQAGYWPWASDAFRDLWAFISSL